MTTGAKAIILNHLLPDNGDWNRVSAKINQKYTIRGISMVPVYFKKSIVPWGSGMILLYPRIHTNSRTRYAIYDNVIALKIWISRLLPTLEPNFDKIMIEISTQNRLTAA